MEMKLNTKVGLLTAVSLSFVVQARAAPVIQNGSFEQVPISSPFVSSNTADIPGWTHSGAVGDALLWAVGYSDGGGSITAAGQGNQFVTLGNGFDNFGSGTSSWSSQITGLTAGNAYLLTFMIANEGANTNVPLSITAGFDAGSSTASQSFTAPTVAANYWKTWLPESLMFVATAATATVDFSTTDQAFDIGLDNVQAAEITTIPEPASLVLLGGSLAALGILRRRQKT
jgi:hypothetical protein